MAGLGFLNEDHRVIRQGTWWQAIKRNEAEVPVLLKARLRTGKTSIPLCSSGQNNQEPRFKGRGNGLHFLMD